MYLLMNETDRLPASPKSFKSEKQAPAFADKLRKLYAMQGGSLAADGRRIAPEDVEFAAIANDGSSGIRQG
jgi:hypothetical protein